MDLGLSLLPVVWSQRSMNFFKTVRVIQDKSKPTRVAMIWLRVNVNRTRLSTVAHFARNEIKYQRSRESGLFQLRIILAFHMALIYYTQDFRVYEETRDQPMPAFSRPTHFLREKPWGRGCPIFLGNFYPLAPSPPRNFHWPSVRGVWIFSGITQSGKWLTSSCLSFHIAIDTSFRQNLICN